MALLIVAGLVVDGTAQMAAHERAQGAAAQIARFATDAAAPYLVDGSDGRAEALAAARSATGNYPDMTFEIALNPDGSLRVRSSTTVNTVFLQLIGIRSLGATGQATAVIYPSR